MVSRLAQRASRRSTNGHKKPGFITGLLSSLKAPDGRLDSARLSEYRENGSKCLNRSGVRRDGLPDDPPAPPLISSAQRPMPHRRCGPRFLPKGAASAVRCRPRWSGRRTSPSMRTARPARWNEHWGSTPPTAGGSAASRRARRSRRSWSRSRGRRQGTGSASLSG